MGQDREGPGLSGIWSVILPDGSIKTKVFRKETHTNQYLNFGSNYPLEHNRVVVCNILHQAEAIGSDSKDREEKKAYISMRLEQLHEFVAGWSRQAPTRSASRRRGAEKLPDLAPDQAGPSVHTETTTFEPTDLEKTKKISSGDSIHEGRIRAGEKSEQRLRTERVFQTHKYYQTDIGVAERQGD